MQEGTAEVRTGTSGGESVTEDEQAGVDRIEEGTESSERCERFLRGRVVTDQGEAIAGARLHALPPAVYSLDDPGVQDVCVPSTSDDRGRFELGLRRNDALLIVCRKVGFVPASRLIDSPGASEVEFVLGRGASISGRVVDQGGIPLAGARVHARASSVTHEVATGEDGTWPGADAARFGVASSDRHGRFEVAGLDSARGYVVDVTAVGYAPFRWSLRTPELIRCPPADVGDVPLMRIYVAVFGVRQGRVDLTGSLRRFLFSGGVKVEYPEGYELAYSRIPRDRFPAAITRRLESLDREGGVILVRPALPTSRPLGPNDAATIRILHEEGEFALFRARLVPIGSSGWDKRQLFDLPRAGAPPPGIVLVRPRRSSGEAEASFRYWLRALDSRTVGGWFVTSWDDVREAHVAVVPPGSYEVRRAVPTNGLHPPSTEAWDIHVGSEEETELVVEADARPELVIDPRLPSGSPARDLAVYVRRQIAGGGHDYLVRIMEPFGCAGEAERIRVPRDLKGRVELIVRKTGYEIASGVIELSGKDITWRPALKAYRPP